MDDGEALTTLHVHKARDGENASVAWLVERFTPLLLAQARYRLGPALRAHHEPEDLVHDVWAVALPALPKLRAEGRRATPVFLAFLARTLLLRVNELARRQIHRRTEEPELAAAERSAHTRGVVERVASGEAMARLTQAIEGLDGPDREVLVLRGIEQLDNRAAAQLLGCTPNAASLRYNRVLERLRRELPDSILDELD
jgi:RNA polymerase sigma factor (sigma-70 family)